MKSHIVYIMLDLSTLVISRKDSWLMTVDRYFNFCVPFSILLDFCEDYKHVIINARHELILIWMRNGNNYIVEDPATKPMLELFKVQWWIPHIALNEVNKLSMLRALESGWYLSMSFRSWDLYEYPLLPSMNETFLDQDFPTQLEKPLSFYKLRKKILCM